MKVKVISLLYIFPGFVCFVRYLAKISGERLQGYWSSGFLCCCFCFVFFLKSSFFFLLLFIAFSKCYSVHNIVTVLGLLLLTVSSISNSSLKNEFVSLFVLRLNVVPVNNFSVMSGRRHRFLGITSTFGE